MIMKIGIGNQFVLISDFWIKNNFDSKEYLYPTENNLQNLKIAII
jgi:hypothetical protein